MLNGLHSLAQVTSSQDNHDWPLFCCPATSQWLNLVHGATGSIVESTRSNPHIDCSDVIASATTTRDAILRSFELCVQSRHTRSGAGDGDDKGAALERVARHAKAAVLGDTKGFPGPMCSPFRRLHADMLLAEKYTLTEKSDGLRVILVVLHAPGFPAWVPQDGSDLDAGDVPSVMQLERVLRDLTDDPARLSAEVTLRGALYEACLGNDTTSPGNGDDTEETGCNVLLCLRSRKGGEEGEARSLCLRRAVQPRHLVYALDRAMDAAYLLLDEHRFGAYDCIVFDAELLLVQPSPAKPDGDTDAAALLANRDEADGEVERYADHLALGLFDLYSYTDADGTVHHQTRQGTLARYERLRQVASTACEVLREPTIGHMTWFVKDVWTLDQLGDCLTKLHRDEVSQMYWYESPCGRTRNDGFIFTPDHFDLCAGASRTQVKWKWRTLLSVDWRVAQIKGSDNLYNVWLYFRKINFSYRDDAEGYWQLGYPLRMLNPHHVPLPRGATGAVVECMYDEEHQLWSISRLRHDRQCANSITTVISVFESLAESVSLATLLHLLHIAEPSTVARALALEPASLPVRRDGAFSNAMEAAGDAGSHIAVKTRPAPPPRVRQTVRLILRAIRMYDSSHRLYLCWCTNRGNKAYKRVIPCPLCEVKDCNGFGYTRHAAPSMTAGGLGSDLERLLYIRLANAGGSYAWSDFLVEATFDGAAGTWELLRCIEDGRKEEAAFDGVLEHLNDLIRLGTSRHTIAAELYDRDTVVPGETATCDDTLVTNRHYSSKACTLGRLTRDRSALRQFNNWIKSVLLEDAVRLMRESATPLIPIRAVDLCCGRGGDLPKWKVLRPAFVYLTDASFVCVAEAAARYCVGEGLSRKTPPERPYRGFDATFAVHDVFDAASGLAGDLHSHIALHGTRFNVVSCQFSIHYGFASKERVRYFLSTVAAILAPGGVFVGTTISDDALRDLVMTHGGDVVGALYEIHMPSASATKLLALASHDTTIVHSSGAAESELGRDDSSQHDGTECFGISYRFSIEDTVTDVPEYVVPWKVFVEMSREYDLDLVHECGFVEYFEAHKDTAAARELAKLLARKRGRDGGVVHDKCDGDDCGGGQPLPVPSEVLEVARLYRIFIFAKAKDRSVSPATT